MVKQALWTKILYFLVLAILLHITIGLPINLKIPKKWKEQWKASGIPTYFQQTPDDSTNTRGDANHDKGKDRSDNSMLPPEIKEQLEKTGVTKPFELKK